MPLFVPQAYLEATPEIRAAVCNGCGAGGWRFDIIPDNLYGLDISEACNIHDWMYTVGETEEDKRTADRVFLENMYQLINDGAWVLRAIRRRAAKGYFESVSHFGAAAFWQGK